MSGVLHDRFFNMSESKPFGHATSNGDLQHTPRPNQTTRGGEEEEEAGEESGEEEGGGGGGGGGIQSLAFSIKYIRNSTDKYIYSENGVCYFSL